MTPRFKNAWLASAIATVALMVVLLWMGRGLDPDIITFEFAGTEARALEIVAAWEAAGQLETARLGTWIDYIFIAAYVSFLGMTCFWGRSVALKAGRKSLATAGFWVAMGQVAAGVCDAVENIGLFFVMSGEHVAVAARVAQVCASIKFSLVGLGMIYGLVMVGVRFTGGGSDRPRQ